jgi:hypothetical protein
VQNESLPGFSVSGGLGRTPCIGIVTNGCTGIFRLRRRIRSGFAQHDNISGLIRGEADLRAEQRVTRCRMKACDGRDFPAVWSEATDAAVGVPRSARDEKTKTLLPLSRRDDQQLERETSLLFQA